MRGLQGDNDEIDWSNFRRRGEGLGRSELKISRDTMYGESVLTHRLKIPSHEKVHVAGESKACTVVCSDGAGTDDGDASGNRGHWRRYIPVGGGARAPLRGLHERGLFQIDINPGICEAIP